MARFGLPRPGFRHVPEDVHLQFVEQHAETVPDRCQPLRGSRRRLGLRTGFGIQNLPQVIAQDLEIAQKGIVAHRGRGMLHAAHGAHQRAAKSVVQVMRQVHAGLQPGAFALDQQLAFIGCLQLRARCVDALLQFLVEARDAPQVTCHPQCHDHAHAQQGGDACVRREQLHPGREEQHRDQVMDTDHQHRQQPDGQQHAAEIALAPERPLEQQGIAQNQQAAQQENRQGRISQPGVRNQPMRQQHRGSQNQQRLQRAPPGQSGKGPGEQAEADRVNYQRTHEEALQSGSVGEGPGRCHQQGAGKGHPGGRQQGEPAELPGTPVQQPDQQAQHTQGGRHHHIGLQPAALHPRLFLMLGKQCGRVAQLQLAQAGRLELHPGDAEPEQVLAGLQRRGRQHPVAWHVGTAGQRLLQIRVAPEQGVIEIERPGLAERSQCDAGRRLAGIAPGDAVPDRAAIAGPALDPLVGQRHIHPAAGRALVRVFRRAGGLDRAYFGSTGYGAGG